MIRNIRLRHALRGLVVLLAASASTSLEAQVGPPPPLRPLSLYAETGDDAFVSQHVGTFNGKRVKYRAEVAETRVHAANGAPVASLFTTTYQAVAGRDSKPRPVMFVFNGGPGAASAFVHLMALGPRRLADLSNKGLADTGARLMDNQDSLLDVADLVFIDPPGTGFSKALSDASADLNSIDGDSELVAVLIRHWLDRNRRTGSPIYIWGESYGSLRAVALGRDLTRMQPAVRVDGIILNGQAITHGQMGRVRNPAWIAMRLPMMASLAHYHGKIDNKSQSWEEAVERARRFAYEEYLPALAQGYRLDPSTREKIASALPPLIGIPETYFRENNTIVVNNFNAELLKDRNLVLDGNDGRQTLPKSESEPDYNQMFAGIGTAMNRYMRDELTVSGVGTYAMLIPDADATYYAWNFQPTGAASLDVTLADLMRSNPDLRLLVTQGRHDTLTTIGSTEYTLSQSDLPWNRVAMSLYDGGHTLLPHREVLDAMRKFLRRE